MRTLKLIQVLVLTGILGLATTGCMKGPKGEPGSPVGAMIATSVSCNGVLPSTYVDLAGIQLDFTASFTKAGDVYASGAVIYDGYQSSRTAFYSASQAISQTPEVKILDDAYGAPLNSKYGEWTIRFNAQASTMTVIYSDLDYPYDIVHTFSAAHCVVNHWQ